MVKVSQALRDRLLGQQRSMSRGIIIDNKGFTRQRMRLLPVHADDVPGVEYAGLYAENLDAEKKGTASPVSFGVACPVMDFLDRLMREGTKEEKKRAFDRVRRSTDYWMGVIIRGDEGVASAPKLRVLRGKKMIYQQIIQRITEEDIGEDITDAVEGRDIIVKKAGQGLETEWTVQFADRDPIHSDKAMARAIVEAAKSFDVRAQFYPVERDVLAAIYEDLSGESIPDEYMEALDSLPQPGEVVHEAEADAAEPAIEVASPNGAGDAAAEGDGEIVYGETAVEFENEGTQYQGVVEGEAETDATCYRVVVDGEPWDVPKDAVTVLVAEAGDAVEEAPPQVARAARPAAKPAPKAAPAKPAPKPSASKPAPGKAPPRKPLGKPAAAGKASTTIAGRLRGKGR